MNTPRSAFRVILAAALTLAASPGLFAADAIAFNPGNPWAQAVGNVSKSDHFHEYTVNANAGKTLQINLVTKNPNLYFTVMPAESHKPLIDTQKTGDTTWSAKIDADAAYTVRVYEEPDATPSGEITKYALQIGMF